jgi:hypothetical protein
MESFSSEKYDELMLRTFVKKQSTGYMEVGPSKGMDTMLKFFIAIELGTVFKILRPQ